MLSETRTSQIIIASSRSISQTTGPCPVDLYLVGNQGSPTPLYHQLTTQALEVENIINSGQPQTAQPRPGTALGEAPCALHLYTTANRQAASGLSPPRPAHSSFLGLISGPPASLKEEAEALFPSNGKARNLPTSEKQMRNLDSTAAEGNRRRSIAISCRRWSHGTDCRVESVNPCSNIITVQLISEASDSGPTGISWHPLSLGLWRRNPAPDGYIQSGQLAQSVLGR